MSATDMARFRFRITTRHGCEVTNLVVQGRDRAHAEAKLLRMYPRATIVSVEDCAPSAVVKRLRAMAETFARSGAEPA